MSLYYFIKPNYISLFSGGGGSSIGYKKAHFNCLGQVDSGVHAVKTLKKNFPDAHQYYYDINTIDPKQLLEDFNIKPGDLDLLDASPPCQGFSMSGKMEVDDKRNVLYKNVFRIAKVLKPKVIFIENVKGLNSKKMSSHKHGIMNEFKKSGYDFVSMLVNCGKVGLPQNRNRMVFLGFRKDLKVKPTFPVMDHKQVNVEDVLPYITAVSSGQFDNNIISSNNPCCTITRSRSLYLYKKGDRKPHHPSIYELKVLQGFPLDYDLGENIPAAHAIIGNSVTPLLTNVIGIHLIRVLFKKTHIIKSSRPTEGNKTIVKFCVNKRPKEYESIVEETDKFDRIEEVKRIKQEEKYSKMTDKKKKIFDDERIKQNKKIIRMARTVIIKCAENIEQRRRNPIPGTII
ncbi:MAG TPA: DNA (cytosine-5-)-methyltransferase [Spirochaetota bacterium]|nr:DNA (cytosine-5-)-methyltransferase [Spirochaetota bacterium]